MEKRKFFDNELETVMPSFSFKGTLGNSVFRKKQKICGRGEKRASPTTVYEGSCSGASESRMDNSPPVRRQQYMPSRPNTPCRHPGCAALVPYGTKYCEKHRPLHPEDNRSAAGRGYGSKWQKARKRYLNAHPLCVECMKEGRYVKASDVDHIIAHRGDPKLFWDERNWQALCHRHHSVKTRREDNTPTYHY